MNTQLDVPQLEMLLHKLTDRLDEIEELLQTVDTRLHMVEHAMDVYVEELNIIKDKLK
tara:strand:- start:367 stop:540 length:174 start_codon:yes stop_codon:yes gene_type:complete